MKANALLQLCESCTDLATVPAGWVMSEKLDGMRCLWDGGITRGIPKSAVPWAHTGKDARLRVAPVATGLWSRYGGVISAPDWWIDKLPPGVMLDGELYTPGLRQDLLSVVKGGGDWGHVGYRVYDCPPPSLILEPRTMVVGGKKIGICMQGCEGYRTLPWAVGQGMGFLDRMSYVPLQMRHPQFVIQDTKHLEDALAQVLSLGGEGLVVRHPQGLYHCRRHTGILKIKGMDEDEAIVTGVSDGEGRHLGRIGALVCSWKDKIVNLGSGLDDSERNEPPAHWIGQKVTFRYRGLSRDGQPQEPRFVRRRDYETQ
jgi:DNA ligase 1